MTYTITKADALLRIDIQGTFIWGGLPVAGGLDIIQGVNHLSREFKRLGATVGDSQDWHPKDHSSLASNNPGTKPYDVIQTIYGPQVMWPDHGIEGTPEAEFHDWLDTAASDFVIRKGRNREIDSYSAFYENDRVTSTGLAGLLRERGVKRVFLVGLAYDFCVGWSAIDAVTEGFKAVVLKDLTRAVDAPGSVAAVEGQFDNLNVDLADSSQLDFG